MRYLKIGKKHRNTKSIEKIRNAHKIFIRKSEGKTQHTMKARYTTKIQFHISALYLMDY
jgi:hypothetical protein